MEQWTSINGNTIKVRNRLTCHRTDSMAFVVDVYNVAVDACARYVADRASTAEILPQGDFAVGYFDERVGAAPPGPTSRYGSPATPCSRPASQALYGYTLPTTEVHCSIMASPS